MQTIKPTQLIPQHNLVNSDGKNVAINYEEWGTDNGYNGQHAHLHNFYEILFFLTGAAIHDIDFTTWKAHQGAVHFVAPENVYILLRDKNTDGCSLMFTHDVFPEELLSRMPFSHPKPTLQLNEKQLNRVNVMLDIIREELNQSNEKANQFVRMQMQALLHYLSGIYTATSTDVQSSLSPQILAFRQALQQHFKEHLNVNDYAERLHISPKHLIDLCKKNTGKTPLQLIREYTVAEAKRLLYNTGLTVKEVAYELNFDDPANFSKYFKSVCGYSPANYRREGK
jgi:AraC-like DNA-binding protein